MAKHKNWHIFPKKVTAFLEILPLNEERFNRDARRLLRSPYNQLTFAEYRKLHGSMYMLYKEGRLIKVSKSKKELKRQMGREDPGPTSNPVGTKLTKVRVKVGKRIVPGMARKKNGKVQVFVTPQIAKRINPDGVHKWTMAAIKAANNAAGYHFFDRAALRAFDSRILPTIYQGNGGVYFVSSEQFHGSTESGPRTFTVRRFEPGTGRVHTATEFNKTRFVEDARAAAKRMARG